MKQHHKFMIGASHPVTYENTNNKMQRGYTRQRWIPLTKGQCQETRFHVMTSSWGVNFMKSTDSHHNRLKVSLKYVIHDSTNTIVLSKWIMINRNILVPLMRTPENRSVRTWWSQRTHVHLHTKLFEFSHLSMCHNIIALTPNCLPNISRVLSLHIYFGDNIHHVLFNNANSFHQVLTTGTTVYVIKIQL